MEQVVQRMRVGAYVVCVRDDAVLLARFAQSRRWTLPGGRLDHGERPEDAAIREVDEETGLRIALGPLIGVDSARWDLSHDGNPVDVHALRVLYTGEVVGGRMRDETGGSTDRAEWIPLSDVPSLDTSSLVTIGLAAAGRA